MKNKWHIAQVVIMFSRLKGNVKTESGRKLIRPGEWFMSLVDNPVGKWISNTVPDCLSREATEEEIKEHFAK